MKSKGRLKKLNAIERDKTMKDLKIFFQLFFKNKFFLIILISSFLLNLSLWIILGLGLDFDKTVLILHYNSFFGIDKISVNAEDQRFLNVFFVSGGGLFIMLIDYLLGFLLLFLNWKNSSKNILKKTDKKELSTVELGGYFLFLSGLVLQVLILVYTIAIVLVNR